MVLSWEGRRIEVDIPAEVDPQGLQLVVPFPGERHGEVVSEMLSCSNLQLVWSGWERRAAEEGEGRTTDGRTC